MHNLERLILDVQAEPEHYLMWRSKTIPRAGVRRFPDKPMSEGGMHRWWNRCLSNGGIVPKGTTGGEKMHKARYTAGQRVLDHTGNLVAVKNMLHHKSIQTTADIYVDWDVERLAQTMVDVLGEDE